MENQGGIGSVGSYDIKLSGGVAEVSLGLKVDLGAELQKLIDAGKISNALEKSALEIVIGILKGIA